MSLVHAVIIAGGQGQRLGGVRKGSLRIGGLRLIDRASAALGPVADPLMVSTGSNSAISDLPEGAEAVPDLPVPCAGPLAGLAAAVTALRRRGVVRGELVSVAVDTPFLPTDFVARMVAPLAQAPASYAAWKDDFYPPNAAWRIEAIADLPERMAAPAPPASLKALQRLLGAEAVDWSGDQTDNPFHNVNTIGDVIALERRARSTRPLS
jgi:molybdopterin-guanine dinucleotide biosynthesis protein A